MSLTMQHEHDNIFRVDVAGRLEKAEFDRLQTSMAAEIGRLGPIRMLFVLKNFEGWEPGQNWGDLSFYMKHGDSIERIAIVGDERWRSEALMFAAADLRRGPVEFFPDGRLSDARAWLAG
jgi:stage II sporulation SpoAA-like protein